MNNQHTIYFCQDGLEIELPQGFKFDSHIHNQFFFRTKNYAGGITLFVSLEKYRITMNPPDEIEIGGIHQFCIKRGRITDHAFFDAEELIMKEIILATNQVHWQWEAVFRLENIWVWLRYGDTRDISETVFMTNKERLLDSKWVLEATRKQIETPQTENGDIWRCGYGYQFWCSPYPKAYRADGAFGQVTTVLPEKGLAIAVQCPEWGDFDKVKLALHEVFFSQL